MIRKMLAATLLLGTLSSPAFAAKLTTTHFSVPDVGSLVCRATNVSNKELPVTIKIVTMAGSVLLSQTYTLAPGAGNGVSDGSEGGYFGRCEFTFPGARSAVRAATFLHPANSGPSLVMQAE